MPAPSAPPAASRPSARPASGIALLAALTALLLPDPGAGADWTFHWRTPAPQGNTLYGTAFESASTGLAVGALGTVLRTTDGGATWADLSDRDALAADLRDVIAQGAGQYLAVGEGVFRTIDGGASWAAVPHPAPGTLRKIDRLPSGALSAIGEAGGNLRSTDAGATWTAGTSTGVPALTGQDWRSDTHGRVVGLNLAAETTDAGQSWAPISALINQPFASDHTEVRFLDDDTGWVFAHFETWKTTDAGLTWTDIRTFGEPIYLDEVVILGPQRRIVSTNLEGAGLWETTDDGQTWVIRHEIETVAGITSLRELPGGGYFATSTGGDLLRSPAGVAWTNATEAPRTAGNRQNYDAIAFTGAGTGFSGGSHGFGYANDRIWVRTTDGGTTWHEPANRPEVEWLSAIEFVDPDTGMAGGQSVPADHVWKTTDAGDSWTALPLPVFPPFTQWVLDLELPSPAVAYALTNNDNTYRVLRSTDAGASWILPGASASGLRWNGIAFVSETEGWVGGGGFGNRSLLHTTDAGVTWDPPPAAGLPNSEVLAMAWLDPLTGIVAAGGTPSGLHRTTDGGASWSLVSPVLARQMDFLGDRGVAANWFADTPQVTTDGGATWEPVPLPIDKFIGAVAATPSGFVVVGNQNLIVEAIRSDATPAPLVTSVRPAAAALTVRPSIGTRFELAVTLERAAGWELQIVDVGGRRVAHLGEGRAAPGETIRAMWDPGRAAAGVYFAKLQTGHDVVARKLVLLR